MTLLELAQKFDAADPEDYEARIAIAEQMRPLLGDDYEEFDRQHSPLAGTKSAAETVVRRMHPVSFSLDAPEAEVTTLRANQDAIFARLQEGLRLPPGVYDMDWLLNRVAAIGDAEHEGRQALGGIKGRVQGAVDALKDATDLVGRGAAMAQLQSVLTDLARLTGDA